MHYLALNQTVYTNWTTFGGVFNEKLPKIGPK